MMSEPNTLPRWEPQVHIDPILLDDCSEYEAQIRELTAERDKYRDACERLIANYGDGQWTCCKPSYLHDCSTDKCWLTNYEGADQGADFSRQVKAELERIEGSEIEVDDE